MTTRQKQILAFMLNFRDRHQRLPTAAILANEFDFTPQSAAMHILRLQRLGALESPSAGISTSAAVDPAELLRLSQLEDENERLRAEVERLRAEGQRRLRLEMALRLEIDRLKRSPQKHGSASA
jgi:hypothetical protein